MKTLHKINKEGKEKKKVNLKAHTHTHRNSPIKKNQPPQNKSKQNKQAKERKCKINT